MRGGKLTKLILLLCSVSLTVLWCPSLSANSDFCDPPLSLSVPWKNPPFTLKFWNGRIIDPSLGNFRNEGDTGFLDCVVKQGNISKWKRVALPSLPLPEKSAPLIALFEENLSQSLVVEQRFLFKSLRTVPSPSCSLILSQRILPLNCQWEPGDGKLKFDLETRTLKSLREVLGRDPGFDDPFSPQNVWISYQGKELRVLAPVLLSLSNRAPVLEYFSDSQKKCRLLLWDPDRNHLSVHLKILSKDQTLREKIFSTRQKQKASFLAITETLQPGETCSASYSDGTHLEFVEPKRPLEPWENAEARTRQYLTTPQASWEKLMEDDIPLGVWQDRGPRSLSAEAVRNLLESESRIEECFGTKRECRRVLKSLEKTQFLRDWSPEVPVDQSSPWISVRDTWPFFQIRYFQVQFTESP